MTIYFGDFSLAHMLFTNERLYICSSFKTAYCFPDLAGDVDVISDAEVNQ